MVPVFPTLRDFPFLILIFTAVRGQLLDSRGYGQVVRPAKTPALRVALNIGQRAQQEDYSNDKVGYRLEATMAV